MQQGYVYRNSKLAGIVTKDDAGKYHFKYDQAYLEDKNRKKISVNFPLQSEAFSSDTLFPFFANMLAEGNIKEIQCKELRIDKNDDFSRLIKSTGNDNIGSIIIKEKETV